MDDDAAGHIFRWLDFFNYAQSKFYLLFEWVRDPMAITQADGVLLALNARLRAQLKDRDQDWVGRTLMELIQENGLDAHVTRFKSDPAKRGRMLVVFGKEKTGAPKNEERAVVLAMIQKVNPAISQYNLTRLDLDIMLLVSIGAELAEIATILGFRKEIIIAYKHFLYAKLRVSSDVSLVQRGNDLKLLGKNGYWYR